MKTSAAARSAAGLSRRDPRPPCGSSPGGEREVAGLAAAGLSDREIAQRLVLSERTVHSHLHRAYAKLGVTGRGELPGTV